MFTPFLKANFKLKKKISRIGRTGRKGHSGLSISFLERGRDECHAPNLVKMLQDANKEIPNFLNVMAGGRSNDFDRNPEDIRTNTHHRQPHAPYTPGILIIIAVILYFFFVNMGALY